jgi:hypothetical protein
MAQKKAMEISTAFLNFKLKKDRGFWVARGPLKNFCNTLFG